MMTATRWVESSFFSMSSLMLFILNYLSYYLVFFVVLFALTGFSGFLPNSVSDEAQSYLLASSSLSSGVEVQFNFFSLFVNFTFHCENTSFASSHLIRTKSFLSISHLMFMSESIVYAISSRPPVTFFGRYSFGTSLYDHIYCVSEPIFKPQSSVPNLNPSLNNLSRNWF